MLSLNPIARVTLTTSSASFNPAVYDTGLILVKMPDEDFDEEDRLLTYESAAQAAAGLEALGFTGASLPYRIAQQYFAASPAPSRLLVSCFPISEGIAAGLTAVLDLTSDFYGVCPGQGETAEVLTELAGAVEAADHPMVLFVPVVGTAATVTAAGALLDTLLSASLSRTFPFYTGDTNPSMASIGALLGTAMGLQLSHPDTAFSLCYKTLAGVTPSDLTASQVSAIEAKNGNVYITRGYTHHLLERGTLADGSRYDERLYLDMIATDLQTAAVTLLAENPDRLPQTDDASAQFINRFSTILLGYTGMGVLATAAWRGIATGPLQPGDTVENGFALWADSYDIQSDEDRAAHKAMPIHAGLTLAGSLESVVIAVNVQI